MKKENKFATEGWRLWLEKSSQAIQGAWKFANEFNLLEKIKNIKVPSALKVSGLALLLSSKSLDAQANDTTNSVKDANVNNTEVSVALNDKTDNSKIATFKSVFRAYPGKYYNEVCNGSPCWLSSTFETNGAGIGKRPSSIATWNDNGNYRGLNQISPAHAQKFLKWLEKKSQFQSVYTELKKGGVGKANWQKTAKDQEHLMTEAFEWYMVEVYNTDNFKFIQDRINKAKVHANVRKLHPAIISAMHQLMVQRPARRTSIANKIIRFVEEHNGDAKQLNSKEFIQTLVTNKSVQKRALELFDDTAVQWKTAQFDSLLSKVIPENDDMKTWFNLRQEEQQKLEKEAQTKRRLAQGAKDAKDASRQSLLNLIQPAQKGIVSGKVNIELKLAREQVSSKKTKNRKTVQPLPVKQDIIDDRLLKSQKGQTRG